MITPFPDTLADARAYCFDLQLRLHDFRNEHRKDMGEEARDELTDMLLVVGDLRAALDEIINQARVLGPWTLAHAPTP